MSRCSSNVRFVHLLWLFNPDNNNSSAFYISGQTQLANKSLTELKELFKYRRRERGSVTLIATRLAISRNYDLVIPEWLAPTHKDKLPKSERVAFPKPPKGPGKWILSVKFERCVHICENISYNFFSFFLPSVDGSLLYEKIPNAVESEKTSVNNLSPSLKKRSFEDANGKNFFFFILNGGF